MLAELLANNQEVIKSTQNFSIDLTTIKKEINREMTQAFNRSMNLPYDWEDVIKYCIQNNISPRRLLLFLHVLKNDEENFSPKNKKEEQAIDDLKSV